MNPFESEYAIAWEHESDSDDPEGEYVLQDFGEVRKKGNTTVEQLQRRSEEEFQLINTDERAIQDFHSNHNFKVDPSFKQLLYQKLNNWGQKIYKNGSPVWAVSKAEPATLFSLPYHSLQDFNQAFARVIWMSYRKGFKPLLIEKPEVEHLTTDCNWGCAIRCAQMMMANALQISRLLPTKMGILRLFDDDKRGQRESAFSIQNVVAEGLKLGKLPGDWYGIQSVCSIFEALNDKYKPVNSFRMCVFQEGMLVLEKVEVAAQQRSSLEQQVRRQSSESDQDAFEFLDASSEGFNEGVSRFTEPKHSFEKYWLNSVLIVVNVRLGLDSIPEQYFPNIKKCMNYPQFVGLIGGKPNLAFYFVGYQEPDNLIFLDPHYVMKKPDSLQLNSEKEKRKFKQEEARFVHLSKLDPCMGFAFLVKTLEDFHRFVGQLRKDKVADGGEGALFSMYSTEKDLCGGMDMLVERNSFLLHSNRDI